MSLVPPVTPSHTFNGDLAASSRVDAGELDSALGTLAAAHNAAKSVIDAVVGTNNRLVPGSVGLPQLDAGVRELFSELSGSVFGATAKLAVATVAIANVAALSGLQTINGYALLSGNRILLTAQSTASQNGIWIAAAGAWTRATDLPAAATVGDGWYLIVAGGTSAGTAWASTSPGTAVIGTGNLTFAQVGTLGVTSVGVASTDLTVSGSPVTGAGTLTLNIAPGVVTNTKLATVPASTVKANITGGSAAPSDVSLATFRTALASGTPTASTFLRGDGTWASPVQALPNLASTVSGATATLTGALSSPRVYTLPDISGLIPLSDAPNTWAAAQAFSSAVSLAGYLDWLTPQATPASPATGWRSFLDLTGRLAYVDSAGRVATIGISGITASRTWSFPDATGTIPLREVAQSWALAQTFSVAPVMTSLTGLLKGNGASAVTVAVAGTDYVTPTGSGAGLTALNATNLASGTVPAARMPAHTGDATSSAGSVALTIAAGAVTLAKMANLAATSIIGNSTGGAAVPAALTPAQVRTVIDVDSYVTTAVSMTAVAGSIIRTTAAGCVITLPSASASVGRPITVIGSVPCTVVTSATDGGVLYSSVNSVAIGFTPVAGGSIPVPGAPGRALASGLNAAYVSLTGVPTVTALTAPAATVSQLSACSATIQYGILLNGDLVKWTGATLTVLAAALNASSHAASADGTRLYVLLSGGTQIRVYRFTAGSDTVPASNTSYTHGAGTVTLMSVPSDAATQVLFAGSGGVPYRMTDTGVVTNMGARGSTVSARATSTTFWLVAIGGVEGYILDTTTQQYTGGLPNAPVAGSTFATSGANYYSVTYGTSTWAVLVHPTLPSIWTYPAPLTTVLEWTPSRLVTLSGSNILYYPPVSGVARYRCGDSGPVTFISDGVSWQPSTSAPISIASLPIL